VREEGQTRVRDMTRFTSGKGEKGMVNIEYKRYLARIPKTYAIVKLGYRSRYARWKMSEQHDGRLESTINNQSII
jgi:hypothetical protein